MREELVRLLERGDAFVVLAGGDRLHALLEMGACLGPRVGQRGTRGEHRKGEDDQLDGCAEARRHRAGRLELFAAIP